MGLILPLALLASLKLATNSTLPPEFVSNSQVIAKTDMPIDLMKDALMASREAHFQSGHPNFLASFALPELWNDKRIDNKEDDTYQPQLKARTKEDQEENWVPGYPRRHYISKRSVGNSCY